RQMKVLGLNLNLAPVADINNNPNNPVINYRSFGENKIKVTNKTLMYSSALQDGGIAATAKHFPGHGDTDTDSHHALPQINHSKIRFDTLELLPFKNLIASGISSVMSAHLNIPAYDPEANLPSTLSKNIIKGLLKDTLGFNGLVITDAMNMRGLTDYYDAGVADALAYAAGNDVLEYVEDAGLAINSILKDLEKGLITTDEIEEKCRKILALKYWCGLSDFKKINTKDIDQQLNIASAYALVQDLYANALTVLNNQQNVIPLRRLESRKIATLTINGSKDSPFNKMVNNYVQADKYSWKSGTDFSALISSLENYDIVLTIVLGTDQRPYRDFGVSEDLIELLSQLSEKTRLVGVYSGNPYAIDKLPGLQDADGLIISYQENKFTQELAAQLIFGAIGGHGKLPVTINRTYPEGYGIITPGKLRLQYGYPENGGVSSALLNKKIDSIVRAGLDKNAFPGCEVIAARKGVVIFHKAYGYHTFLKRTELKEGDIFDLASVTKVSAATAGLMKLDDMGLFDPDKNLGLYYPFFKGSDKADIRLRDILAHQAGLQAWIPYWKNTVKNDGSFKCSTFRTKESKRFNIRVSDKLYLNKHYKKKMFRAIKKSPIGDNTYLYSGLMFYIFPEIINQQSGLSYESFLNAYIYHKLGAYNIGFNPYNNYPMEIVVPTENDTFFRNEQLRGFVHDEGAAMMGGLSGNAGLFASANDLLKLFEMFRRYGSYGGEEIITEATMKEYTSYQFIENDNRRGLGFDKPILPDTTIERSSIYPCPSASPASFGHSGYTGTFAWADPEEEIAYVFLSNRVYPTRDNNLISSMNIRTEILQSIYDSIID
ncbi:MAG: glycoside hydrolase family 3 N-terminal domain-containing protein, partial [Bacteroidales bacterium]|nr:glycoside hydrolase family 3 N-terminal domain-containing protein [Bacteroidales bacterium]